jgi:hypothetical protein
MTCREYQDRLAECLGRPNLPADLATHVEGCSDCAEFLSEMRMISEHLGRDDDFYAEPREAEVVMQVVEREIRAAAHITVLRPAWWTRVAGVAAAAVVILGAITVTWQFTQRPDTTSQTGTPPQIADTSLLESQDETEELSSEVVQLLLYDVSTSDNFKAGDELLKDISDEEAVYLRTSLKAGDLL